MKGYTDLEIRLLLSDPKKLNDHINNEQNESIANIENIIQNNYELQKHVLNTIMEKFELFAAFYNKHKLELYFPFAESYINTNGDPEEILYSKYIK